MRAIVDIPEAVNIDPRDFLRELRFTLEEAYGPEIEVRLIEPASVTKLADLYARYGKDRVDAELTEILDAMREEAS